MSFQEATSHIPTTDDAWIDGDAPSQQGCGHAHVPSRRFQKHLPEHLPMDGLIGGCNAGHVQGVADETRYAVERTGSCAGRNWEVVQYRL